MHSDTASIIRCFGLSVVCVAAMSGCHCLGRQEVTNTPQTPPVACNAIARQQLQADLRSASAARSKTDLEATLNTLLADYNGLEKNCSYRDEICTQVGALELRLGRIDDAERRMRQALDASPAKAYTQPVDIGMDHFMLATIYQIRAQYPQAEDEFNKSVKILGPLGAPQALATSGVYQDMALLYIHIGDLRSAEQALGKSLEFEQKASGVPPEKVLLTRDTLVHLRYSQGRYTDALTLLNKTIDEYGENNAVSRHLRAHLYRDAGEIHILLGKPGDALGELRNSISLLDAETDTPGYAVTKAILAQAYSAENDLTSADRALTDAYHRAQAFQSNFPEDAAAITVAYGSLLNKEKRWEEARPLLAISVENIRDRKTELSGLKGLIEADHHMHDRQEEAESRRKLKALLKAEPSDNVRQDTVDVMTFNSASSH